MATSNSYEWCFDEDVQRSNSGCPECDGRVTTNTSETVCDDCGLVLEDNPIDYGPEWRHFEGEETDRSRVGMPRTPTQHDGGLATEVSLALDGKGRALFGAERRRAWKLSREQSRTVRGRKHEQNRMYGNFEIGRVCSGLELGEGIREQACALFATAQAAGLLRGRSVESVAAASVYAVCRLNQRPVTQADIERYAHESGTSISWAYRTLNTELELPVPPRQPKEFLASILSALGVEERTVRSDVQRRAAALLTEAERAGLANGRNPRGLAAAALYHAMRRAAGHERVTQGELASTAGVTPVTLRARWYELRELSDAPLS
jgi:transcription initiation factor TFIIB